MQDKNLIRFFVDGETKCDYQYRYPNMIVPRVGERVWLADDNCYIVTRITYSYDEKDVMIDVDVASCDVYL